MNRKEAATKTALSGLVFSIFSLLLGFVTQKIFINKLGLEYSGINGVLTSIVGILTMSDLGVSTAVILNLYKPLANNNKSKIAALMRFYHKACIFIGSFIIVGSLLLLPFIPKIVGETSVDINLYIVFLLFSATSAFSYFLNHRRPLLIADQKAYQVNRVVTVSSLLSYLAKIAILLFVNNYYFYLLSVIVFKIAENILISRIVKKNYPYLKRAKQLDIETKTDIKKKIIASVFHNAGSYVVFSTDNILLTTFFGVATTGIYANYSMVISSLTNVVSQIFNGISAGFGNIISKEGKEHLFNVSKRVSLLSFWFYSVIAIASFFCLKPFITLWLGAEYIFDDVTCFALIFNFFLVGIRAPVGGILNAGGIVYENRFIPILEAIINLGSSIILAKIIGIPGVFIGTIISNFFLHLYAFPKYAYQIVLKKKATIYLYSFFKQLLFFTIGFVPVYAFCHFARIENQILAFIIYGVASILIPSIIYVLCFFKNPEFRYFVRIASRRIKK